MMLLYAFSRKISLVTQQDFEASGKFLGRERKSSVLNSTHIWWKRRDSPRQFPRRRNSPPDRSSLDLKPAKTITFTAKMAGKQISRHSYLKPFVEVLVFGVDQAQVEFPAGKSKLIQHSQPVQKKSHSNSSTCMRRVIFTE